MKTTVKLKKPPKKNWSPWQPRPSTPGAPLGPFLLGGALLLLAACTLAACTRSSLPAESGHFIAPSIEPQSSPIILETFTPLPPTATPECENDLVFLQDLTIPDGTHMQAGEEFEKVWQVRNEGSCVWGAGYYLGLTDGDALGTLGRQPLPASNPGDVIEIRVNFVAPDQPGSYRSAWKAHDFGDTPFGVLIYLEIIVD